MDHNQPPPANMPPPQYPSQYGEMNQPPPGQLAPPPYAQQTRDQVQLVATPISQEAMIGYIARAAAAVTAFLATVIIGTARQTKYDIYTVKFSTYSAFKYFLAANVIVLVYSIASVLMSILIKSRTEILKLWITIIDIVLVSMLLTANGAASAISAQFDGIDNSGSDSNTCDYYDKFCSQIKASIAMSMLAVGIYLGITIFTLVTLASNRN